ncbi:MAG: hypothetical protein ACYC26_08490 [Phycisphaerales bacterium]
MSRLFPPPAGAAKGRWESKGVGVCSRLALPGRVQTRRRRYQQPGLGGVSPMDRVIDLAGKAVSLGVREVACR